MMARTLIAVRVLVQVQLVILLSGPPLASGNNLGDNAALPPLLVGLACDLARRLLLLGVVEVDAGAVLGAGVAALAVEGGRVVHAVKELDELAVGDFRRVEDDLGGFGVC